MNAEQVSERVPQGENEELLSWVGIGFGIAVWVDFLCRICNSMRGWCYCAVETNQENVDRCNSSTPISCDGYRVRWIV